MKTVITGKFEAEKQAARAVEKLLHSCIRGDHVRTFFLKPTHPRAAYSVRARRPGSSRIGTRDKKAAYEAPVAAGTVELEVGPAAVADGVEISAAMGSLPQAPGATAEENQPARGPSDEILVAVEASDHVSQVLAVSVLREYGAHHIERDAGVWHELTWPDFHPVPLSSLLEGSTLAATEDLRGVTRH